MVFLKTLGTHLFTTFYTFTTYYLVIFTTKTFPRLRRNAGTCRAPVGPAADKEFMKKAIDLTLCAAVADELAEGAQAVAQVRHMQQYGPTAAKRRKGGGRAPFVPPRQRHTRASAAAAAVETRRSTRSSARGAGAGAGAGAGCGDPNCTGGSRCKGGCAGSRRWQ